MFTPQQFKAGIATLLAISLVVISAIIGSTLCRVKETHINLHHEQISSIISELQHGDGEETVIKVQGARGVVMSDASPVAVVKTAASAKEVDTHLARMPHHSVVGDFLSNVATPEQVSLLSRLVDHLQTSGMPFVKGLLDAHPEIVDCAQEHGFCAAQPKCLKNGKYQVHFGNPDKEVSIMHEATPDKMPYSCNVPTFGRDPVPGDMKRCWMDCAKAALEVNRVEACPKDRAGMATHEHVWALIPSCSSEQFKRPEEKIYQEAISGFCSDEKTKIGMKSWLDCNFRPAYINAVKESQNWNGKPSHDHWIDRAWVTFFKGSATGMKHSFMVTNLIRSVEFFSKYPIIVVVFDTNEISKDWDHRLYKSLIVIHADGLESMLGGRGGISFNFNKFRAMFQLRVRTGVQVDADMVVGANCDRLFDATEKHVTSDYPYPIMPVHWMSRHKEEGKYIDGFAVYAAPYPDSFPPRIRWAHCHPTWTYHALPFIADALLAKIDSYQWQRAPRVMAKLGATPALTPPFYLAEDEDLLNIMLWRYQALKQWCKWDVEPDIFDRYLKQETNGQETMIDTKWYPEGVPLVIVTMHNTKHTVVIDKMLGRLAREGFPDGYLFFKGKYYANPEAMQAAVDMSKAPCLLI